MFTNAKPCKICREISAQTITGTVDENGESYEFERAGRFGEWLHVGQIVSVRDDEGFCHRARITDLGSYIHTRSGGGANYVYITAKLL